MIRHKRNVLEVLIFGLTISIASEISASQQTEKVTPTEVFTQRTQIFNSDDTAYYDLDDYVPYRSDTHDYFSWRLLTEVLLEDQENIIFSPFSVKLVLVMIAEAAGNNTKTKNELMGTLTDIRSLDNLRGFYKKVLFSLKKENPYHTFNLETKLYTDSFIEPLQKYEATLQSFYYTNIQRLNFANTHQSAATINEWCTNVTNGRLHQLVNEDNLQNNVMLMANAIYFSGLWRRQFNSTFQGAFFKAPTKQIKVQYMEQTEYFYYYDSSKLDAKILRLPYKGKKFSMFFLLPKTKWGVDELIHNLVNDEFKGIQFMMEEVKIKVTLPKFKFEFNKNLKDTLARLGINEIFTDNASLPGLARGADVARKLKVSNIFQKAGIDVNESGTEAFASTVVEIENKFGGSTVVEEFNVNRPFLFIIEDESTGNIIFAGKVLKPLV